MESWRTVLHHFQFIFELRFRAEQKSTVSVFSPIFLKQTDFPAEKSKDGKTNKKENWQKNWIIVLYENMKEYHLFTYTLACK